MKKFKLTSSEIDEFTEIASNIYLTDTEVYKKCDALWMELGQKYGFVWNSVIQDPDDKEGYLVQPLTKKDFADVHAETIPPTPSVPEPVTQDTNQKYPVSKDDAYPADNQSAPGINKNQLTVYIANAGIEKEDQEKLTLLFLPFFDQAQSWMAIAKTLVVNSVDQVAEMKKADNARLALKQIRGAIERTRKQMKEYSLNYGRAVDGLAKKLTDAIQPIEDYLYDQAKFAELQEELRKSKLAEDRLMELQQYNFTYSQGFNLAEMSDDDYNVFLNGLKMSWDKQQEEIRINEENERIRLLNEVRIKQLGDLVKFIAVGVYLGELSEEDFAVMLASAENTKAEEQQKKALCDERRKQLYQVASYLADGVIDSPTLGEISQETFDQLFNEALKAKQVNNDRIKQVQMEAEDAKNETARQSFNKAKLMALGVLTDGVKIIYKNEQVPIKSTLEEIVALPDTEFAKTFPSIEKVINDFKVQVDRIEKERLAAEQQRNARILVLQGMGYKIIGEDWTYADDKGFNYLIIRNSHISTLNDKLWGEMIADHLGKIAELNETIAKSKLQKPDAIPEVSTTLAGGRGELGLPVIGASDKEGLVKFVHVLVDLELPKMTSAGGKKFIVDVREKVEGLITLIEGRLL